MKPDVPAHDPLPDPGFETICSQYADDPAARCGAAAPALYQTSTFIYPDAAAFSARKRPGTPHYDYTRGGNPTTGILEAKLARLEGGRWCECFASGMGAISAAINICVESGSHVVCVSQAYAPTRWYLQHLQRFGVETTFVPGTDPGAFIGAIRANTKIIYLESPTSGQFELIDVPAITHAARQRGITTMFDNSYATPWFQRPLELGVDLVLHSATKYIGGHSDVVAGAAIGRDAELRERLLKETELCGATLDPFAGWLLLRGLRTLPVRLEHHQRSALQIAEWLARHPAVRNVRHPGLPSHPNYEVGRRQMRGYSGMFSFELREQSRAATHRVLDRLRIFRQGVSWGGYESLAIGGSFFSDDPANPVWLIRLSVGLETTTDLIRDLEQALAE
jgi:cystathionine beta-lyase